MPAFDDRDALDLEAVLRTLYSGKWLILLAVAVATTVTFAYVSFLVPPAYEAHALIIGGAAALDVESAASRLRSPAFLAETAERIGLPEAADSLAARVVITPRTKGNLVEIAVTGRDPLEVARLANGLLEGYVDRLDPISQAQSTRPLRALEGALATAIGQAQPEREADHLRAMAAASALLTWQRDLWLDCRARLIHIDVEEQALRAEARHLEDQLAREPGDPTLRELALTAGAALHRLAAERAALTPQAAALGREVEQISVQLAELEAAYTLLRHERQARESLITALRNEHDRRRVAVIIAGSPGLSTVPATIPPPSPGPRLPVYLALGATCGFLAGTALSLALGRWPCRRRPRSPAG